MRTLTFFVLLLIVTNITAQRINYSDQPASRLGNMLNSKYITGIAKFYPINDLKGRDKMFIYFTAVEVFDNNKSQEVIKGMKVTIRNEHKVNTKEIPPPFDELSVVFDKDEYTGILMAIDDMTKQYGAYKRNNQGIEFFYSTADNFKFGIHQEEGRMRGFAVIETQKAVIEFEMKNVSKFLRRMKEIVDIANQELYLPENAAKLKKAKSSKSSKQVIDEDI